LQEIDLRESFPEVGDQGQRLTCVAFAASAGHSFSRSQDRSYERLSEEMLYWGACDKGGHTEGISFESASKTLESDGQCLNDLWPYAPPGSEPVRVADEAAKKDASYRLASLDFKPKGARAVETSLFEGNPVVLLTYICGSFFNPQSGFVATPPRSNAIPNYHAVLCVGLVEHKDHGRVFVFRNSWGVKWGDHGYGYFSAEFLDTFVVRAASVVPRSPTPDNSSDADSQPESPK